MIVCKYCGKEFEGRSGSKYCCNNCRYQDRYLGVVRICKQCGKEFSGKNRRIYCSTKCSVAYHNNAKYERNTYTERECYCGNKFISNNHKTYCSTKCRVAKHTGLEKIEYDKTMNKFRNTIFKEYIPTERDNIDIPIKSIGYHNIKIKAQMEEYGITPRLKKSEVSTIRGIRRLNINVFNVGELIRLYNIKVAKFREYPHMNVKNTITGIGAIIEKIRKDIYD